MIKNKNTHTIKINPRRTVMKILFYDTKSYDKESFEATLKKFPGIQIDYIRSDLDPRTAALADGFDAVCVVSSNVSEATLKFSTKKVSAWSCCVAQDTTTWIWKRQLHMTYVSCVSPVILRKLSQSMPWLWLWPATAAYTKPITRSGKMISASQDSWASISMVRLPESSEPAGSVQLCAGSVTVSA